jgi:hypothetical protein
MYTLHRLTQVRLEGCLHDSPALPDLQRAGHPPFTTQLLRCLLGELERCRDLLDGHRDGVAPVPDKDRAALDDGQQGVG